MREPIANLGFTNQYGVIPASFGFQFSKGYSVLVGKNDAGKTTLLQWIFARLIQTLSPTPWDSAAIILTDRFYITSHTRTEQTLALYNQGFLNAYVNNPKPFNTQGGPRTEDLFAALLQRTSMTPQNLTLNELLDRVGFPTLDIRGAQEASLGNIGIHVHGAGIRCLLPILAALTSPDIKYLFIDEPELSLEARAQKVVKQLLVEATARGKSVVVATQSHLFLNRTKGELENNLLVRNDSTGFSVRATTSDEELLDLTYNLLGNSLEDLFFPNNFLIVEGASDQRITETVSHLLGHRSGEVKIIAANGIDNVEPSYSAITNTLVPLITNDSPYSKRVVVILDRPDAKKDHLGVECARLLKDRCFVLEANSLEEYLPEALYTRAGRDKARDLSSLAELKAEAKHTAEGKRKLWQLKEAISNAVAQILTAADRDLIPQIFAAVERSVPRE